MDTDSFAAHGAYLRSDLVATHGMTWLNNAVAGGRLRPMWRGVVVEADRWLDPWTRAAAGLLTAGPEAVVAAGTAAILHGCTSITSSQTHLLLPYGRKPRGRAGLVIHHGGFFADDVVRIAGLRTLSIERVAADLLCSARPQDALAIADEVLRRAGDSYETARKQIAACIRRRPDPRGTVRGAAVLDLATPRAESAPESWMRMTLLVRGFPLPEVNWWIVGIDGAQLYRVDFAWPSVRIALEYDGYAAHAGREELDASREADLRRRGWIVVRVSGSSAADLHKVEKQLRAAFKERGYTWPDGALALRNGGLAR